MSPEDFAQHLQSREIASGIKAAQAATGVPEPTGHCRNPHCGEKVEGRNFCDVFCRDEFEELQRLRAIQGKRL